MTWISASKRARVPRVRLHEVGVTNRERGADYEDCQKLVSCIIDFGVGLPWRVRPLALASRDDEALSSVVRYESCRLNEPARMRWDASM